MATGRVGTVTYAWLTYPFLGDYIVEIDGRREYFTADELIRANG